MILITLIILLLSHIDPTQSEFNHTIQCDAVTPCTGQNITGPTTNGSLTVRCSARQSCEFAIITGPYNGNLTVECITREACQDSHIIGPTNGNLFVQCDGEFSCANAVITASFHGDSFVECAGTMEDACSGLKVDGTYIASGSLNYKSMISDGKRFVYCPGNGNECNIECGGSQGGCANTNIYTPHNDSKLYIVASGANAMLHSKIYCPSNGECAIHAIGNATAMLSNSRIYAQNGLRDISLVCNYSSDIASNCYGVNPQLLCKYNYKVGCNLEMISGYDEWECVNHNNTDLCSDNTVDGYYGNHFVCDVDTECQWTKIWCDNNTDCIVYCQRTKSCYTTDIIGAINGNLSVQCTGWKSCYKTKIIGPKNGNLFVQCKDHDESCKRAVITATVHGDSFVECLHGCPEVTVDGTHIANGSLNYKSMTREYLYRFVHCPGNGNECNIECGGEDESCGYSAFYTLNDSKLHITASSTDALRKTRIYCPSNGECSIHAIGDATGMFSNSKIYSQNGLRDISLVCNYSSNVTSNCYGVNPQLICKHNYGVRCNLEMISGYDEWECVNHNNTDLCSDTTVDGYYGNQFVCDEGDDYDMNGECSHIDFWCDEDTDCALECDNARSCYQSRVIGPTNGNVFVMCRNDDESCSNLVVTAPYYGDLTVECEGVCAEIKVNGTHVVNGSLSYKSMVSEPSSVQHNYEIYCPGNGNACIVECVGFDGRVPCLYHTIYAQTDSQLHLTASGFSGTDAMIHSILHCPSTDGGCSIYVENTGDVTLSGGLADFSIVCDHPWSADMCHDTSHLELLCVPAYNVSCVIEPRTGTNSSGCINETFYSVCDPPTFNPTANPSTTPTFNPTTNPSTPTFNPTANPSATPTFNPTANPSATPTFNPTANPSANTKAPSTSPTFITGAPTKQPSGVTAA
eukprot:224428_1